MGRRGDPGTHQLTISVGARESPLSKKQVEEVYRQLIQHHPHVVFSPRFLASTGDIDRKTSLRTLDKTNFFTKEIDDLQLRREIRIAIHSGKDLPDPLPENLEMVAMTKGLDPRDSLVCREGYTLQNLPKGTRIGTSSVRREEMLKKLRSDFQFVDIRGNIEMRLQLIDDGMIDAVVIAECALLRLNLQHLHRHILEEETAPLQGRLAVIARSDDNEMKNLFTCIHYEENPLSRT